MSSVTLNGARITSGSLTIPYYGTWSADVTLADTAEVASSATLVIGDLTLKGTPVRQAAFAGTRSVQLVGGANRWSKIIPAKGYSQPSGVKLSTVLKDAAKAAGEQINVDSDKTIGKAYARDNAPAEKVLALETGGKWWVDPDGVTQTKARSNKPIAHPFTVVRHMGNVGLFEIATDAVSQWQPGRTFSAPQVEGEQTISTVTISVGGSESGGLKITALAKLSDSERTLAALRSLIRAEMSAERYSYDWEYRVVVNPLSPGLTFDLDLEPTDKRMPALTKVPLATELGKVSPPAAGTKCRVRFVNADPARPEVFALAETTEHLMTTEACALLIFNVLAAWCAAAGGGPLLAAVLQPLIMPSILAALAAQGAPAPPGLIPQTAAATALAATMATGTTPSPTSLPFNAAIAALATKTPNVSGAFPSIGIPSNG